MSISFFEGRFLPTEECRLPITDLVIQRGVGVFDSVRAYGQRPFALGEHLDRLEAGARMAGIACDGVKTKLAEIVRQGVRRSEFDGAHDLLIRPYITGGDVIECGKFPKPRFFVIFDGTVPLTSSSEYVRGVKLYPTEEKRPYPAMKSINYLFGLMQGAGDPNVLECLYCPDGLVTETLRSSFFICKDGRLITASLDHVLGGVTRNIVIQLARENGYQVDERCPTVAEMYDADEAFLTGTWKEVMPVVQVGDKKIGKGKPGPVSAHLLQIFRSSLDRWLD